LITFFTHFDLFSSGLKSLLFLCDLCTSLAPLSIFEKNVQ
jgi:hypothetical protein